MDVSIHGWKTYAAAAVAIVSGLVLLKYGHTDQGAQLAIGGLALIGVRSAIAKVIMATIQKNLAPIATIALCVLLTFMMACGGLETGLRVAFTADAPLIDYLETKGKISNETARELRVDVPDARNVALNLASQLALIPKNAPDVRVRKLNAWQTAEKGWIAIVNRGHFALAPETQEWVDLANSIFEEAVTAYGGGNGGKASRAAAVNDAGGTPALPARSDAEIEASLKAKLKLLQKKMESPKE